MWLKADFKKNAAEDTVSAMLILERGLKDNKWDKEEKVEVTTE
jgi:hypothetical protein